MVTFVYELGDDDVEGTFAAAEVLASSMLTRESVGLDFDGGTGGRRGVGECAKVGMLA